MNKFLTFGLIAGAGVLMAGCAKDAANSEFGQNAIEFGTYLGRDAQTKGTVTDDAAIKAAGKGFGVTAFYTGQNAWADASANAAPNFMYNQKVEYSNNAWSYSPVKYWPTTVGDKISFFAYAPYSTTNETNGINLAGNTETGTPYLTFTVADNASAMVDFVAGVQLDRTHSNETSANNEVKFDLKHELSRVGIYAKVNKSVYGADAANKTFVVIKSVKLDNVADDGQFYKSATYTFANENSAENSVKRGTWDLANATKADADLNLGSLLNSSDVTVTGAKEGTSYKTGVNGVKLTGTDNVSLFKDKTYLFLIPVAAAESTSSDAINATATITYDIVTEDSKLAAGYSCTSATKTVSLPAGTLVQGKAYNYVFTINVDEVKLSATVTDWTDATAADVTVDYKDTYVK